MAETSMSETPSVSSSTTNVTQPVQDLNLSEKQIGDSDSNYSIESKDEVRSIQGWRWLAVCISVYSTCLLYGLDTTIAANIQSNVVETYGAVEKLAWLGTGFSLGSIAIIMFV
jgi:hypothetical protein